jgi:hypothetical protein
MNKEEALLRMKPPGARKKGKWREGVIQIWITRTCDRSCFACTQGSNLRSGPKESMYITLENFEIAAKSLIGYHGVVGVFGGNPALHPQFPEICEILAKHIPFEQRGLWCNHPFKHAKLMSEIFNPAYSNLNVHLSQEAYDAFKKDWPNCNIIGLESDSRHSPVMGSMLDLQTLPDPTNPKYPIPNNEENRWAYISNCDINQHWSGMIGQFRGEPRAWFCEIAGAQSMLNQHTKCSTCNGEGNKLFKLNSLDTSSDSIIQCETCNGSGYQYPDTGIPLPQEVPWWRHGMEHYSAQAEYHCHRCLVPLRGYGELACSDTGKEQTTETYLPIFQPKSPNRQVEIIQNHSDLLPGRISLSTNYLGNSQK